MAHPGHPGESGFAAGVLHSLGGIDHAGGFIIVGLLAPQLGRRFIAPVAGVLLGSLVAAWTADGDGWNHAAGFMLGGAILIATGVIAARMVRLAAAAHGGLQYIHTAPEANAPEFTQSPSIPSALPPSLLSAAIRVCPLPLSASTSAKVP
jgi:hydrogenase/urease accessory protein HupE